MSDLGKELIFAAQEGDATAVRRLLASGAPTEHGYYRKRTPLLTAAYYGHVACMQLLLDGGANIEAKDKDGDTALMYAARAGDVKCVELLLKRGASVHLSNESGNTAMHIVAYSLHHSHAYENKLRTFALLRRAGADPSKKNNHGDTPLSLLPSDSAVELEHATAPAAPLTDHTNVSQASRAPLSDLQSLWLSAQTAAVEVPKLLHTLNQNCIGSFDDFVLAHNMLLLAYRQRLIPAHKLRMLGGSRDFVLQRVYLPVTKLQLSDHHKQWFSQVLLYAERVGFIRDGHSTLIDIVAQLRSEIRDTRLEMHSALVTVARKINHLENRVDQLDQWTRDASQKFQQLCDGHQQLHDDMLKMATSLRDLHALLQKQQRKRTIAGILGFGLSMIPVLGGAIAGATFVASEIAFGVSVDDAVAGASTGVTEMLTVDISNFQTVKALTSPQFVSKLDPVARERMEHVVEQTQFQTISNLHQQLSVAVVELDHNDVHLSVRESEEEELRQRFRTLAARNDDESVSAEQAMNEIQFVLQTQIGREVDIEQVAETIIQHMDPQTSRVNLDAFVSAFFELKSKFPKPNTRQVPAELRHRFRAAVKPNTQLMTLFAKPLLRKLFQESGEEGGFILSFRRTRHDWDESEVNRLLKESAVDERQRLVEEDGFIAVGMQILFGENS